MSAATPFAIVGLALVGALVLACLERALAGVSPAPVGVLSDAWVTVREPLRRPQRYDSVLFHGAPALLVLAAVLALAAVPWAPGFRGVDFSAGVLLFAGAVAYVTPAMFMAGWGAGRPLAVVGAFRWLALMLAYAMPVAMVLTAVAAPAGSLRPTDIVKVQHAVPLIVAQPLTFVLWLPAVTAACFIAPFDLPQADSELGGGVFSEYRGLDAGLVALAQRILLLAVSGMTASLFLGGWEWPVLPAALWMAVKTAAVATLILWAGRRVPRVEVDRALSVAWRLVNPLALLAIVIAGAETLLFYS